MTKIQAKRGTQAELDLVTPDSGEPGWTTDTKTFFVGDGATQGAIPVGPGKAASAEPSPLTDGDTWVNVDDEFCIRSDGKTWRLAAAGWTDS